MVKINVIKDFSQIKLSFQRHVNELLNKIKNKDILKNESNIELNIEGCATDYPATPYLIDYFLEYLSKQSGEKQLTIKIDGLLNKEIYILYQLVLEGVFFGINEKIDNNGEMEEWKSIINKKLIENNISLKVLYTPENKEYHYGKENN